MKEIPRLLVPRSELLSTCLRDHLLGVDCQDGIVVARHFDLERMSLVVETGTDRDDSSYIWSTDQDVNHQELRKRGILIPPADIFYAFTWKLRPDDGRRVVLVDENGGERNHDLYYLGGLAHLQAVAIYNSRMVIRKSEWEYWFKDAGDKLAALLAVVCLS